MRVKMVVDISGGRSDGRPWPGRGEELEVPDEEALDLIRGQMAVPAVEKEKVETATMPAAEERSEEVAASQPDPSSENPPEEPPSKESGSGGRAGGGRKGS